MVSNTEIVGGIDSNARADYIQQRIQSLTNRSAATIVISHISTLNGPSPSPNPPTAIKPTISAAQGDATVTITCQTASGRIVKGDKFNIQGVQGYFIVTADTVSSMDVFTNVPISPSIPLDISSGTVVSFVWSNQQKVKAYIGGAFKTQIESGVITVVIKIIVPVLNLSFVPQVGDKVIISGRTYLLGNITPIFAWGKPVSYELLVK